MGFAAGSQQFYNAIEQNNAVIPQIFHIGPLPVNSFGLMVALAFFAALYQLMQSFEHNGIDPALAEKYVFTGGIVGLLGARIWYVLEYYNDLKHDLLGALLSTAGFTFYGGFIFSTIVLIIMARRDKLPLATFLDSMGPALTLSYAVGRVGCQLSGDGDYGILTTSIWGMSYATGVIPTAPGTLAYPTPLYESVFCLLILYILTKCETKPTWQAPLKRFGLYLTLIATERFLVEFLRINPKILYGFSEAQVIAGGIFIIGLGMLLRVNRQHQIRHPL